MRRSYCPLERNGQKSMVSYEKGSMVNGTYTDPDIFRFMRIGNLSWYAQIFRIPEGDSLAKAGCRFPTFLAEPGPRWVKGHQFSHWPIVIWQRSVPKRPSATSVVYAIQQPRGALLVLYPPPCRFYSSHLVAPINILLLDIKRRDSAFGFGINIQF